MMRSLAEFILRVFAIFQRSNGVQSRKRRFGRNVRRRIQKQRTSDVLPRAFNTRRGA